MIPSAAALIRDARARNGVSQAALARRAGTTQKHISRIERGHVSPSVAMLSRLLATMGERLELRAIAGPHDNRTDEELRADLEQLSASERLAQTAALSRTLTGRYAPRATESRADAGS
jgi:transcriptional regulator with XRE-family HTH domain